MNINFTDIAVNLTSSAFDDDRDEVVARAKSAGVNFLVIPGSSLDDSEKSISLAQNYEGCFATAGVHPHNAKGWDGEASSQRLLKLAVPEAGILACNKVVAIGECGLDYNRDFSPRDAQRKCFEDQLSIAARIGKPVFMHEREAFDDFLPILKKYRTDLPGAVVHCFTGGERELHAYLDLDCHIGITGWVCDERRGRHLLPLLARIPANRLMLETDAPYLVPRTIPKSIRGKTGRSSGRNEPSFLPHIAEFVAGILGKSLDQLAMETSENATRFFGVTPDYPQSV